MIKRFGCQGILKIVEILKDYLIKGLLFSFLRPSVLIELFLKSYFLA